MSENEIYEFEQKLRSIPPQPLNADQRANAELTQFIGELQTSISSPLSSEKLEELELLALEAELSVRSPAPLSTELLETLALAPVEAELSLLTAPVLSASFIDSLSSLLEESENEQLKEIEEKVIPFPVKESEKERSPWKWYATAAAVAIMGLFLGTGILQEEDSPPLGLASTSTSPDIPVLNGSSLPADGGLVNISRNSTFLNAQDQGLIPNSTNTTYYQAMKVTSNETFLIENEKGEQIKVVAPVQQTILVPVETD